MFCLYKRIAAITLMEVVVLLVVLAIVVTALVPSAMKISATRKTNATREEMEIIHRGVVGDPRAGHFGFLGDLGRLPASLDELVEAGDAPLHTMNTAGKVGMGWNGPYVQKTKPDVLSDSFGRLYAFGRNKPGQIQSAGPDGKLDTDDDLFFPPTEAKYYGVVRAEMAAAGEHVVRLYYSSGGVQRYIQAEKHPFVFENIHLGLHAVEVYQESDKGLKLVRQRVIALADRSGLFMLDY